jgi:hypothetical protein
MFTNIFRWKWIPFPVSATLGAFGLTAAKHEDSVMKLSDEVRSTHGQDGAVVLDIRGGQMFHLNLVGSRIVELLKSGLTESTIADRICREFCADRVTVIRDLEEFLRYLETNHLIEVRNTEPHAAA